MDKFEYDFIAVNKDNVMSLLEVLEAKGYRWAGRYSDEPAELPTEWDPYKNGCLDATEIDIICLEDCGTLTRTTHNKDIMAVDWNTIKQKYIKNKSAKANSDIPVRISVFTDLVGMKSNDWEIVSSNQKHPTEKAVMLKFRGKNTLVVGDNSHGYEILRSLGFKFKIGSTVEEVKRQIRDAGREFDKENGVTCYIAETEEGVFSFNVSSCKPILSEGFKIFFTYADTDMWIYKLNKANK